MRRPSLLLALAATATLLGPALAHAIRQPSRAALTVTPARTAPGAAAEHVIDLLVPPGVGATRKLELFVPHGYTLASPTVGAGAGDAAATFDDGSSRVRVSGPLVARDPAAHTADECAPGAHAGVWIAGAERPGTSPPLAFYVDAAPPAAAAGAAYVVTACFGTPDLGELSSLRLDLRGVLKNPAAPGRYLWRAVLTQAPPDGTATAPARETQALVSLPSALVVRSRYDARRRLVVFTGRAVAGRSGDAHARVLILAITGQGFSSFGVAHTDTRGRFAFSKRLARSSRFALLVDGVSTGRCEQPLGVAPCAGRTIAPSELRIVSVEVPRR